MRHGLAHGTFRQDISLQQDMIHKLDSFEESVNLLQKMSKQLQTPNDVVEMGYEYIYLSLTENICRNCPAFRECFGQLKEITTGEIGEIFEQIDARHCVENSMAPQTFRRRCIYFPSFMEEMKWLYKLAYQNYYWENKVLMLRQTMQGQLNAQTHLLSALRKRLESGNRIAGRRKVRFTTKLLTCGVMLIDGMEYQENTECVLIVQPVAGEKKMESLIPAISSIYQRNMCLNQENMWMKHERQKISFIEESGFHVVLGRSACNRKGESVNGDAFSFLHDSRQRVAMILADGMGSGEIAFSRSKYLIEVLEQMIQSGIHEEYALEILHQALLFQGKEGVATIDLGVISLQTGMLKLFKAGGCATFIKRKDHVERILPDGLPPGSYTGQKFDLKRKKLYDGDIVVMVSDGVLAFEQLSELPFKMEEIIQAIPTNNAQKFANLLMENIPICEELDDDRTILVASIWEKGKKHVEQN